jgi:hypothetical protein
MMTTKRVFLNIPVNRTARNVCLCRSLQAKEWWEMCSLVERVFFERVIALRISWVLVFGAILVLSRIEPFFGKNV